MAGPQNKGRDPKTGQFKAKKHVPSRRPGGPRRAPSVPRGTSQPPPTGAMTEDQVRAFFARVKRAERIGQIPEINPFDLIPIAGGRAETVGKRLFNYMFKQ